MGFLAMPQVQYRGLAQYLSPEPPMLPAVVPAPPQIVQPGSPHIVAPKINVTPPAAAISAIDPTTGYPIGADNAADRSSPGPQGGIFGIDFGNGGRVASAMGGIAGLLGPAGTAFGALAGLAGNYSDLQAARSLAENLGLDPSQLSGLEGWGSGLGFGLGSLAGLRDYPDQIGDLLADQRSQAGEDFSSAVDRDTKASTEGMAGNDSVY